MMDRFSVVTTFGEKHWDLYGQDMVDSFYEFWEDDITLYVYYEGWNMPIDRLNVKFLPYDVYCWKQVDFRERHKDNKQLWIDNYSNIDHAAIKFSYKVFAQTQHAASSRNTRYLIWMDGDVVTRAPITKKWLKQLLPEGHHIAALLRPRIFTECGFMMYDTSMFETQRFLQKYEDMYNYDGILKEKAWHDCIAFDKTMIDMGSRLKVQNLSPPNMTGHGHPFAKGILGEKLDHLKGQRKSIGFSKEGIWG